MKSYESSDVHNRNLLLGTACYPEFMDFHLFMPNFLKFSASACHLNFGDDVTVTPFCRLIDRCTHTRLPLSQPHRDRAAGEPPEHHAQPMRATDFLLRGRYLTSSLAF